MPTQADDEQVKRFREDAKFLLTLYTTGKMDEKLGTKNNLSGYLSENPVSNKRPSLEIIELFYKKYGKDLERYDRSVPESSSVKEPEHTYGEQSDLEIIKNDVAIIKNILLNKGNNTDNQSTTDSSPTPEA